jgi:hypothetical protein
MFLGLLLDKKKSILSEEQLDEISAWLESKLKKVIVSFLSSVWVGKRNNSH